MSKLKDMKNYFIDFPNLYVYQRSGEQPRISDNGMYSPEFDILPQNTRAQNKEILERVLALEPTEDCPGKQATMLVELKKNMQDRFDYLHPAKPGEMRGWQKFGPYVLRKRDYLNQTDTVGYSSSCNGGYVCGRLFKVGDLYCIENSPSERWSVLAVRIAYPNSTTTIGMKNWEEQGFVQTAEFIAVKYHESLPPARLYKFVKNLDD